MRLAALFLCLLLAACNSPVTVQEASGSKFQIAADAKGGAVWRVNTSTGELWLCAPADGRLGCAKVIEDKPTGK